MILDFSISSLKFISFGIIMSSRYNQSLSYNHVAWVITLGVCYNYISKLHTYGVDGDTKGLYDLSSLSYNYVMWMVTLKVWCNRIFQLQSYDLGIDVGGVYQQFNENDRSDQKEVTCMWRKTHMSWKAQWQSFFLRKRNTRKEK